MGTHLLRVSRGLVKNSEHLLSLFCTVLTSETATVYLRVGEVTVQWDMGEDDVGSGGGRKSKKERSSLHVS